MLLKIALCMKYFCLFLKVNLLGKLCKNNPALIILCEILSLTSPSFTIQKVHRCPLQYCAFYSQLFLLQARAKVFCILLGYFTFLSQFLFFLKQESNVFSEK